MRKFALIAALIPVLAWADTTPRANPKAATPPTAPTRPHTIQLHGDSWADPYFWLKNKTDPETIKYIEAENAYTAAVTKPLEPLRDKLYQEMLGRIKQTDLSVPTFHRGWWYYSRQVEGKQYGLRCRKKGTLDAPEEIMLDGNVLAEGKKFMGMGPTEISDDGNTLLYAVDFTGFREYDLYAKDLRTGKLLSEKPIAKSSDAAFSTDGKTIFYVTEDAAKRASKLWRHVLGTSVHEPLYEEKDELFRIGVSRSRDDKFLFLSIGSFGSTEWRYIPADQPNAEWKTILPREKDHEYSVSHRDGQFFIRTNRDAKNYRVVTASVAKPTEWKEIVPHRPAVFLDGMSLFADYLVLSEREAGIPQIAVHDLGAGSSHRIAMPEPAYSVFPAENPEYKTDKLRFNYTSMVTPMEVVEYDLKSRDRKVLKKTEVVGGYDPTKYRCERIEATAPDGTKVPMTLVARADRPREGGPCFLTGYGAYGSSAPMFFSSSNLSLVDRGVVYVIAHIRGGKDLGQHWHDQGKMLNKKNSFTDFIACADHLVKEKYASRDRLVIQGGSAGGLLMGGVVGIRPDVAKAVILDVPFVDVISTMLDESLPLTVGEFLEWGNPKVKAEYEYMKSYCPYTNLKKGAYPAMLVTTSLNDSQVLYHEPTKYVAKLRTLKTDPNVLLFKCNMAGGHGGSSGRYDVLKEQAFRFAFALDQMGLGS
ncbi:MAG: S9 family peptidase [Gemmataceae bacterium]|nr:S9 family peptidase [Gemmataceae bacterium]